MHPLGRSGGDSNVCCVRKPFEQPSPIPNKLGTMRMIRLKKANRIEMQQDKPDERTGKVSDDIKERKLEMKNVERSAGCS